MTGQKESVKLRQIGASPELIEAMEQREAVEDLSPPSEFVIYREGLFYASVCSSLPLEQVKERMARIPSGTQGGWGFVDEPFATGQPNPCPCDEKPTTHKHFLFSC